MQESVYKRRRCGGNYDAPLIITGCPRTGTSALAQCLSRHAAMCVLPEACVYDLDDDYLAGRRSIVWDQVPFAGDGSPRGNRRSATALEHVPRRAQTVRV